MSAQQHKEAIAQYAAQFLLQQASQQILGIGTGSTVNCLIAALAPHHTKFLGALSSSEASTALLKAAGFKVFTPEEAATENLLGACQYYIDGADEINPNGEMIKGGGGALTREKIVAQFFKQFICIADASKQLPILGAFPLPIEVLPAACVWVKQVLREKFPTAQIVLRQKDATTFVTDNQCYILDIHGLIIEQAAALEKELKAITGVVEAGIFAKNKALKLMTTKVDEKPSGSPLQSQIQVVEVDFI